MKSKIVKLSKNNFVRNVLIMISGTAAAQAVTMALSPVITRLYGPEAFGLVGVFIAIVGVFTPIAALTYPLAIVLPKNDRDAKGIIRLSLYITTGISIFVALIFLIFNQLIARWFRIEDVAPYLYFIPIIILFSGFLQVVEQWLIRTKQFGITAKVSFLHALILQGSKVSLGFFHPVAVVLIILSALSEGLKAIMMIIYARRSVYKSSIAIDEVPISIRELSGKYKDFPLFRAPEVFLYGISQSLPVLLLTSFFGPASAGFYSICRTVLAMPSMLLGKSVGDVFYPRISEAANNGENLTPLIKKATISLGIIGILPYGIIVAFGPWLFSFVFGSEWVTAGEYARWIALLSFFGFLNRPSVTSLPVLSAQAFQLKFTFLMLLSSVAALAIGYYLFSNDLAAISFFGVTGAILNICLILITLHKSKNFDNKNKSDKDCSQLKD
ncbi:lipopolysaccharide biosynthesis protein [Peribacillus sp. YIM B13472]|uniref:lipopolysaccharide biosynthesis protein n=1 Tax=Peribacillus sp. YIM B13472 TaxID=3366297 RepID=UPI0036707E3D